MVLAEQVVEQEILLVVQRQMVVVREEIIQLRVFRHQPIVVGEAGEIILEPTKVVLLALW
tara:strand:- start:294 stop:473 length:180 start_codon:yes stop_codon:yes gene_type:complete